MAAMVVARYVMLDGHLPLVIYRTVMPARYANTR